MKYKLRYLVVGVIAYSFELGALFTLHRVIHLSSLLAEAISFWVGLIAAFILQKYITFQNYDRQFHRIRKQFALYILLVAWNYLFTLTAVKVLETALAVEAIRTIAILITTTWNYFIYNRIFGEIEVI